MYIKYGNFQFEPWEAGLAVRMVPNRTDRGFRRTLDVRFDIDGELCISGTSNINARLLQIQSAFSRDFQDCGLFDDSNNPTVHYLQNDSIYNLTGNLVLYQQYPQTIDGEYISGRKFKIGVAAEISDARSNIIAYQDSIRFQGNAGPLYHWNYNRTWGFWADKVSPTTMQTVIHEGYAVALRANILPPAPFYAPPFERNTERVVEFTGPKARYARGATDYVTMWRYVYELPFPNDGLRPTRR